MMPTFEELMANQPGGDEDPGDTATFLGVPKGYKAVRPSPIDVSADPSEIDPKYREGDQYRPKGFPPEARSMIQAAMDRAGLYGKGDSYVLGDWQEVDSTVYTKLLKYANRYGYTDQMALEQMRTITPEERASLGLGGAGSTSGTARDPLVVSLSHPDDIRNLADTTARKTLGRKLTPDQLTNFVAAYQNMQRETQAAEYNTTSGSMTAARDPEVFAETAIAGMDPLGAEAKKEVEVFKTISAHLGGIRGGS